MVQIEPIFMQVGARLARYGSSRRWSAPGLRCRLASGAFALLLFLATGCGSSGHSQQQVTPPGPNAIPASFFGFTINKECSVSDVKSDGASCNNPEHHSFPGLPFTWSRSLGSVGMKWNDIVICDPTGTVCPIPGSGCSKFGVGANGQPCPTSSLVAGCTPNAKAPDDPTNCAYDWRSFNARTLFYNNHEIDWMYTAYYTPDYLSVRGSRCTGPGQADFGPDATCVGAPDLCGDTPTFQWGCDPPADIDATPGSGLADGTNQNFENFVTAFTKDLQQIGGHITYWEVWNEPNNCIEWNHRDEPGTDCTTLDPSGGPSTGTSAQIVHMAQDARNIVTPFDSSILFTSPPTGGTNNKYLNQILTQGGQLFDLIGTHGYYNVGPGCPSTCPVPEAWISVWNALTATMSSTGQSSKAVLDTEFTWGAKTNVTDPDMRAAQTARIYLLKESYYPALSRVDWFGEDFPIDLTPNPNNNGLPNGGLGEFWASGATNVQDHCTVLDTVQGGYDCPAGLAIKQVHDWTVGATFSGPCTCSASPNGGSCSHAIPTGVWQCGITTSSGSKALFVWDNTWSTFPCANAACGNTPFTLPSQFSSDWQDLNGNVTSLSGASSVTIGAKPILLE